MKLLRQALLVLGGALTGGLLLTCAAGPAPDVQDQAPPPLETSIGSEARLFAAGIVSSELPEFATSFSADGLTVYFNRMPADRSEVRIWSSKFEAGSWSDPAPLPFSDGKFRDVDPFVSPDGTRLYFSSTRPLEGEEAKEYDLWFCERIEDGWGEPTNLGAPINTTDREIYSTQSANGNLYFSVFETGGDGVGIYRSVWKGDAFLEPERLTIGDGTLRVTNPTIAPDESFLLFVSDHEGQADIYVSRRLADGGWGNLEPLASTVNSGFTEFAPHISPDGTTLYFTSERPGMVLEDVQGGRPPGDLYVVSLEAATQIGGE